MEGNVGPAVDPGPRPIMGLKQDGTPLYRCEGCNRTLGRDAFNLHADGRPNSLCNRCLAAQLAPKPKDGRTVMKRSWPTWAEKECAECHTVKSSDGFYGDRKGRGGLANHCKECERKRRDVAAAARKAGEPVARHANLNHDDMAAVIDQAVAERDAAVTAQLDLVAQLEDMKLAIRATENDLRHTMGDLAEDMAQVSLRLHFLTTEQQRSGLRFWFRCGCARVSDEMRALADKLELWSQEQ